MSSGLAPQFLSREAWRPTNISAKSFPLHVSIVESTRKLCTTVRRAHSFLLFHVLHGLEERAATLSFVFSSARLESTRSYFPAPRSASSLLARDRCCYPDQVSGSRIIQQICRGVFSALSKPTFEKMFFEVAAFGLFQRSKNLQDQPSQHKGIKIFC